MSVVLAAHPDDARPGITVLPPAVRQRVGAAARRNTPGLALAVAGVAAAWGTHALLPAVPRLTAAVALGILAAHLPGVRPLVRGPARPGLALAARRMMRLGIVLLGCKLSLGDLLGLGWSTVVLVLATVAATFAGTLWLGRRLALPGDQPLLIAAGYAICGASAIGAVGQAAGSEEEDAATSVALVTLCGTLAIAVLPLLHHPLGLDAPAFGRWVGASVHDVGQVVATAQTGGPEALRQAVVVKLMRVALLAPLVAGVALAARRRQQATADAARPPVVPLFLAGFLLVVALRSLLPVPAALLDGAAHAQELLLAAALFGLGSAVHLPTLATTGRRVALLGLAAWAVVAGVSYTGLLLLG